MQLRRELNRTIVAVTCAACVCVTGRATAAAEAEPVQLRYAFEEGETFTLRLFTRLVIEKPDEDGTESRLLVKEEALWHLGHKVAEIGPDGSARLEMTLRELDHQAYFDRPGGRVRVRYDSRSPPDQQLTVARAGSDSELDESSADASGYRDPPQKQMLGQHWTYRVGPQGAISEVARLDPGAGSSEPDILEPDSLPRRIAAMLAALWPPLPQEKLLPGRPITWTHASVLPLLGTLKQSRSIRLLDRSETHEVSRIRTAIAVTARPQLLDVRLKMRLPSRESGMRLQDTWREKHRLTARVESYESSRDDSENEATFEAVGANGWRLRHLRTRHVFVLEIHLDEMATRRTIRIDRELSWLP